jgi:hypothetical protein
MHTSSAAGDNTTGSCGALSEQADPQNPGIPQPPETVVGKWRDLFSNNRIQKNFPS